MNTTRRNSLPTKFIVIASIKDVKSTAHKINKAIIRCTLNSSTLKFGHLHAQVPEVKIITVQAIGELE